MKLLITTDKKLLLNHEFCDWLIMQIRKKILLDINIKKVAIWQLYLEKILADKILPKQKISADNIILQGINNLEYIYTDYSIEISVNNKINIQNLDQVKLISIIKLINYGNKDIVGYPIFTDTFNYFAENIDAYIDKYISKVTFQKGFR